MQTLTSVTECMGYSSGLSRLLLSGIFVIAAAQVVPRLAAPSAASSGAASVAGASIIAYDIDRLLRTERRPPADVANNRAEVRRILLTASSHRGVTPEDRTYLAHLVAARTGISATDAQGRVSEAITKAKQNLDRARHVALLMAFMVGAAALIGAVAAWYAAIAAGRHREGVATLHPIWDWDKVVKF